MVGSIGADIKGGVQESVMNTHEISKAEGGSGNNMHGYTVANTNADEVRLRNEAKLEEGKAKIQDLKAQQLNQQAPQNMQGGQQKQAQGQTMIAAGMALAGTLVGGWGGAAMVAAGMGMVMMGQQQQGLGQQQMAQVPPTEQAAVQHQGVSDQKNSEADAVAAQQPLETNPTEEEDGNDNPADGTYAAIQGDDETDIGNEGEFGDDGVVGAGSISEEEVAMLEELGTSSEELQNVLTEIEANASEEDLSLYKEIFEGESDEDIALLTNQFLESDFAEGVSSENYIEKFLEFALSDENGDGLNPETGLEIASAEVDGTVDETNTVITDSDGVDPSLGDETDTLGLTGTDDSGDGIDSIALTEIDDTGSSEVLAGTNGTVSREGLDDIRSGIFGTSENG
ncbi:MAG: hypothetical protein HRT47_05770 [Candidatus Caenarcaniphilales bacterium]|nr:hypothetical protein [Candidatus Caenarcaniphilales bacterium]